MKYWKYIALVPCIMLALLLVPEPAIPPVSASPPVSSSPLSTPLLFPPPVVVEQEISVPAGESASFQVYMEAGAEVAVHFKAYFITLWMDDPQGETIFQPLRAGYADFTFVADTAGEYTFWMDNTLIEPLLNLPSDMPVTLRLVIREAGYPPRQFEKSIIVPNGEVASFQMYCSAESYVTVGFGNCDIFYVKDPMGNLADEPIKAVICWSGFTAVEAGYYTFYLDNTIDGSSDYYQPAWISIRIREAVDLPPWVGDSPEYMPIYTCPEIVQYVIDEQGFPPNLINSCEATEANVDGETMYLVAIWYGPAQDCPSGCFYDYFSCLVPTDRSQIIEIPSSRHLLLSLWAQYPFNWWRTKTSCYPRNLEDVTRLETGWKGNKYGWKIVFDQEFIANIIPGQSHRCAGSVFVYFENGENRWDFSDFTIQTVDLPPGYFNGDVNDDCEVSAIDITAVEMAIAGISEKLFYASDVNRDGSTNAMDIIPSCIQDVS